MTKIETDPQMFDTETRICLTVYDSTGGKVRIWEYDPADLDDFIEGASCEDTMFVGFNLDDGASQVRVAASQIVRVDVDWELSLHQQMSKAWQLQYRPKLYTALYYAARKLRVL